MGRTLGALLARTSLSVKEWGPDPDEKPDKVLLTEAMAVGTILLAVYILVAMEAIAIACGFLVSQLVDAG